MECPDLVKRKREEYTLHTHADQGPIGMPSLIWLYVVMGMRGFLFWDAWHRFHGGVMRALKAAGLWPLICEVVVVLNLPGGPWHGAAFFNAIRETATRLKHEPGRHQEAFMLLFERIAKEVNEHVSNDWGSRAHVDRVWNAMWEKTRFRRQGLKVKPCRWWSFFDALEDLRHQWSVRLLVQMYIGMLDGWWTAEDLHEETPCLR